MTVVSIILSFVIRSTAPAADEASQGDTDALLDRWVEAKRAKNWYEADKLREELRAMGIEPDKMRPPLTAMGRHVGGNPETEAKLDEWVSAKRQKDFVTADRLREELRAQGINPDQARPINGPPGGYPPSGRSPAIEAKLEEWVQAKRVKDFTTADRLREELRAQGVNPEVVRPVGGPPPGGGLQQQRGQRRTGF